MFASDLRFAKRPALSRSLRDEIFNSSRHINPARFGSRRRSLATKLSRDEAAIFAPHEYEYKIHIFCRLAKKFPVAPEFRVVVEDVARHRNPSFPRKSFDTPSWLSKVSNFHNLHVPPSVPFLPRNQSISTMAVKPEYFHVCHIMVSEISLWLF